MKLFQCQQCGQPLFFENTACLSCGRRLGYLPECETISALEPDDGVWRALADPQARYRPCENAANDICNWMVPAESTERFCVACRHNRTIPNLSEPRNVERWRRIEVAKHRLFYTLLRLRLPLTTRNEDPDGLAFDFLDPGTQPVMTGHEKGLITLNLAEADDAERERLRGAMGEPYRTLLGHFRHEIAHYYWDRLVRDEPAIDEFRTVFGDERADYAAALARYYAEGAPADWPERFVTAYASAHPWEDFAETWAHYLHMVDTLETAQAFGLRVRPKLAQNDELSATIDFDPHVAEIARLIDAWLPLTFAVNSVNRSMGLPDLYPFVLAPAVIVKLTFVHQQIRRRREGASGTLRAMAAGLRRNIAHPRAG